MTKYLDKDYCMTNTQILAEGDQYTFWKLYQHEDPNTIYNSTNWKSARCGSIITVGRINDRPINVELHWYEIDGVIVCLYDGISQLVDWKMIEDFMEKKFPKARTIVNSRQNYHNVFHYIRDINQKKKQSMPDNEPSKKKTKL